MSNIYDHTYIKKTTSSSRICVQNLHSECSITRPWLWNQCIIIKAQALINNKPIPKIPFSRRHTFCTIQNKQIWCCITSYSTRVLYNMHHERKITWYIAMIIKFRQMILQRKNMKPQKLFANKIYLETEAFTNQIPK